jgi:rhomboid protease GluP
VTAEPNLLARLRAAPVTATVLFAYLLVALLADPLDPSLSDLVRYGALVPALAAGGEPWRMLSHAFVHGGFLHLLFNTMVLVMFGPLLEERLGSARLFLLYWLGALGGAVVATPTSQSPEVALEDGPWFQATVGGSGALFGLLGAALASVMRQGRHLLEFLDYYGPRQLLLMILLNFALGLMVPVISNAAHFGGLVTGFAFVFWFVEPGRRAPDRVQRLIQAGCVALFVFWTAYCIWPVARLDFVTHQLAPELWEQTVQRWRVRIGG